MIILLTGMAQLNTRLTRELAKLGEAVETLNPKSKTALEALYEYKNIKAVT